ncbi:hypothetical protein HOD19_00595 [bacterium]|jgi:asparagine N-glycosylation enzyme membrane subunit Stt3|nr:hypothetical protein [bacterium]MBT4649463.1 hypothetical protein [bacterium]
MGEQNQNIPQGETKKEKCTKMKPLWCQAIFGVLIIILVWWWTPSWADIAITVLAALIIIRSFCVKNLK